ncbi:glycosyltransferase, partial [Nitrosomonas sp.]|uniref:glycosyltransferase n=1 Tax=Nitrosomonas sp. TaxID=42353 RepID=UPI0035B02E37
MQDLEISVVLFTEGRVAQELRTAGLKVVVIAEHQYNLLVILWKLVKHFREHQFMIVHAHKPKDNFLGALACKLAGVPYLVRTLHGSWEPFSGFEHFKIKVYEYIDVFTNKYLVNVLIAVTQKIHFLIAQGYLSKKSEKVVCIHNGVDIEAFLLSRKGRNIRSELDLSKRTVLLGIVGRLTAVKGHIHLLNAIRILVGKGSDVHLIVVGEGPLRSQLEGLVVKFQIHKNVIFVGHQSDISDFIEAMDILVLPSLNEGIPMLLLEALALSRPIVASRTGGIPEVIEDGKSGLLVEPGNFLAIAEAIDLLIRQKDQADQFGRTGQRRVSQNFTASLMAEKTARLYRQLVGSGA